MLNKVLLMGRLTKDPSGNTVQGNKRVLTFSIAVDRDGKEGVDFFTCVAWEKKAEFIEKYFSKGQMVVVEGRLQHHEWTDRDGNQRKDVEVIVQNAYFGEARHG